MKSVLFLLLSFLLLFSSCSISTYYYSSMSATDSYVFKNNQGEFVIESDSIDLIYNFNGENAPITVGVYNKMSKPVYVDWRQSGVIIDNHSATYREPLEEYAMRGDTGSVNYGRYLNDPDGLSLVKSGTRLNTQVLELTNFNFHKIPEDRFGNNHLSEDRTGNKWKYKSILYTEEDSPIYIDTFLTIHENANNLNEPLFFEAGFYLSELINGQKSPPSDLPDDRSRRGDFFYVKREKEGSSKWKKFGDTSLKVLGGAAIVTGNIILWALGDRDGVY